jgi:hypothetical protein
MPGPGKGRQRRSASGLTGRATAARAPGGRHGTTTLFAALNVLDGTVIGECIMAYLDQHNANPKTLHLGQSRRRNPPAKSSKSRPRDASVGIAALASDPVRRYNTCWALIKCRADRSFPGALHADGIKSTELLLAGAGRRSNRRFVGASARTRRRAADGAPGDRAHEELLQRCDIYAGLWHLRHRHLQTRPSSHDVVPPPRRRAVTRHPTGPRPDLRVSEMGLAPRYRRGGSVRADIVGRR